MRRSSIPLITYCLHLLVLTHIYEARPNSRVHETVTNDGYEYSVSKRDLKSSEKANSFETDINPDRKSSDELEDDVPCVDIPPPWSPHSCVIQAEYEKCDKDWMRGYCLKSCGQCKDDKKGELSDHDNPSIAKCPKSCNNKPPSFSLLSCETQQTLGKCDRPWMRGSCECTCGTCKQLKEIFEHDRKNLKTTKSKESKKSAEESVKQVEGDTKTGDKKLKTGHVRFTILHFNDFHSRVEEADNYFGECTPDESSAGNCHGGVARMKTVIDNERRAAAKRGEKVMLLNSGDDFAGTKWDQNYKGKAAAHFLNKLDIDAMTLGNHEFDYGPDVVAHYLQSLNHSVVCANIKPNNHWIGSLVQPYIIKEIDGHQVGICGTTTQVTMQWSKPWPVQFDDSSWKTSECVENLKSKGIKIIIILSHEGLNADRYLGRKVPDIDLIIGGHSHAFLYSGDDPPVISHNGGNTIREVTWDSYPAEVDSWVDKGRKVLILQAGWASRYIGRFSVEFDENGEIVDYNGWPILLGGSSSDHPVQEDQECKKEVIEWKWW